MDFLKLTPDPLSVDEISELVSDPSCGAISLFIGTTRDHFEGKVVSKLEYEVYNEMANKEMKKICREARARWNVKNIGIHHRLGVVGVKEASVILAVSSEHRRESLDAVSFLIDALKSSVPIWKREVYADNKSEWKQNKECSWTKNSCFNAALDEGKAIKEEILDWECDESVKRNGMSDEGTVTKDVNPTSHLKRMRLQEEENDGHTVLKRIKKENSDTQEPLPAEEKSIDPYFVQIIASKEEMERRIKAFQDRKREELNVMNIQEFCITDPEEQEENSCARTTAVVLRSKGSSSHLKYTKVFNEWGPQTATPDSTTGKAPNSPSMKDKQKSNGDSTRRSEKIVDSFIAISKSTPRICEGIEERLKNMEDHLHVPVATKDISLASLYSRLKALEDRILYLEGLSPEYFGTKKDKIFHTPIKKELKATEDDLTLDEIDKKIFTLRKKIKEKQLGIGL